MSALASLALAGCLALDPGSDQIRAGDLAPLFPEMASLAADLAIAPAPAPGVVRVFRPGELLRLAALYNLPSAPPSDLCVARPLAILEPERLLEAMRLEFPGARIELLEFSRQPAPGGTITFPKSGLRPAASAGDALWMGWVRYGGTHRFSIWARVKIAVHVERVIAGANLRPGQPIAAREVELSARDEFPRFAPGAEAVAASLQEVVGKWPRQPIRAGEAIRAAWLQPPQAVRMGETVKVQVRDGGAQLELEGLAEGSGAVGEMVNVRNPNSHRRFRARVEGPGRVVVDAAGTEPEEVHP